MGGQCANRYQIIKKGFIILDNWGRALAPLGFPWYKNINGDCGVLYAVTMADTLPKRICQHDPETSRTLKVSITLQAPPVKFVR